MSDQQEYQRLHRVAVSEVVAKGRLDQADAQDLLNQSHLMVVQQLKGLPPHPAPVAMRKISLATHGLAETQRRQLLEEAAELSARVQRDAEGIAEAGRDMNVALIKGIYMTSGVSDETASALVTVLDKIVWPNK